MNRYETRYSAARAKRGMKPWGVFEIVSPEFSRGISQHDTEAEADQALSRLRGAGDPKQ